MNQYHVYAHKQQFNGINASSPQDIGVSQSIGTQGQLLKGALAINIAAKQLAPIGRVIKTNILNSTGDSRLKRNIGYVETGLGFGVLAYATSLPVAIGVGAIKLTTNVVQSYFEERDNQVDSNFNVKSTSTKVKQNVFGGGYYD